MSELIVTDDQLAARLGESTTPIELRTPDGRRLGRFTPEPHPRPRIGEEEMDRRVADATARRYTAAEVEAKLREWR